jgi:hypothetical protein
MIVSPCTVIGSAARATNPARPSTSSHPGVLRSALGYSATVVQATPSAEVSTR